MPVMVFQVSTTSDCCLKWIKSERREPEEKIRWEACSLKNLFYRWAPTRGPLPDVLNCQGSTCPDPTRVSPLSLGREDERPWERG